MKGRDIPRKFDFKTVKYNFLVWSFKLYSLGQKFASTCFLFGFIFIQFLHLDFQMPQEVMDVFNTSYYSMEYQYVNNSNLPVDIPKIKVVFQSQDYTTDKVIESFKVIEVESAVRKF